MSLAEFQFWERGNERDGEAAKTCPKKRATPPSNFAIYTLFALKLSSASVLTRAPAFPLFRCSKACPLPGSSAASPLVPLATAQSHSRRHTHTCFVFCFILPPMPEPPPGLRLPRPLCFALAKVNSQRPTSTAGVHRQPPAVIACVSPSFQ